MIVGGWLVLVLVLHWVPPPHAHSPPTLPGYGVPRGHRYVGVLRLVLIVFLLMLPHILLNELHYFIVPVCSVATACCAKARRGLADVPML